MIARKPRIPPHVDEANLIWIKCLKCGYKWYPNANNWKRKEITHLRCSVCQYRNKVSSVMVKILNEQAEVCPEWGVGMKNNVLTRKPRRRIYIDEKDAIWIKCLKCGYKWYPNANKWKKSGEALSRVLRCPTCRYRNRISLELSKKLIELAKTCVEWGIGKVL